MGILKNVINQIKNPWQYILLGLTLCAICYYNIELKYTPAFILISLGFGANMQHLILFLWATIKKTFTIFINLKFYLSNVRFLYFVLLIILGLVLCFDVRGIFLKALPFDWFLFAFVTGSWVFCFGFFKAMTRWRRFISADYVFISIMTTIILFICFLSPASKDYPNEEIKKIFETFTAFGPIIIGLGTIFFACKQYQISKNERKDKEIERINKQKAEITNLILYIRLQMNSIFEAILEFQKQTEILEKDDSYQLTDDERDKISFYITSIKYLPVIKFSELSYIKSFLRFSSYFQQFEFYLRFLESSINEYAKNCQSYSRDLQLKNVKMLRGKSLRVIYKGYVLVRFLCLYTSKDLELNYNFNKSTFDRDRRKIIAEAYNFIRPEREKK